MRKIIFTSIFLCLTCIYTGCKSTDSKSKQKIDPDIMLGSIVNIVSPKSVPVEGVGLVGGLNGKGSSECPLEIREHLKKLILAEVTSGDSDNPGNSINVDSLIDSLNTAVVLVEGTMPVEESDREYFDLKVTAYRGTQTVSLENGWLYHTELKALERFGIDTESLADAVGPVFTDQISDSSPEKRTGYVLGGGKVLAKYIIGLVLNVNDFELTNNIRNRLNFRFGRTTARAVQSGVIEVTLPPAYKNQRGKFVELIKTMYVYDFPQNDQKRIEKHIQQIIDNPESNEGEYALEAIGNQSLNQLATLLSSSDQHVKLRAARCMLNLRSLKGMNVLIETVLNKESPYRIEALQAITNTAIIEPRLEADVSTLALELIKDEDFNIRLAAYEQLYKIKDSAIKVKPIGSTFFVEQIKQSAGKDIYVTRKDQPKVILLGAQINCNKGFMVQSANRDITIEAPDNQDFVIVTRKFPSRPDLPGKIKCSCELGDIIEALCDELPERGQQTRGGLGVSYSDLIALLKQMCDEGAISAQFHAGPMPKFD